jgi:integrase
VALTDTFVKQVKWGNVSKSGDKHADGSGMYLLVKASGKYWRMDYRHMDKRKTLALGVYPDVTLLKARKRRAEARELLADGRDPGEAKKETSTALLAASKNTFESVAREFHQVKAEGWSQGHADKWLSGMVTYLFPALGKKPIASITAPMLLVVLRLVEKRGIFETVHTLKQCAGQVFRYGIQTGRCERNQAADLQGALKPVIPRNFSAIVNPVEAGAFMRAVDGYSGHPCTRVALALSALIFQRPGNVSAMEWAWVDLDAAMIAIPSNSMKRTVHAKLNGSPHYVPLSRQSLALLREIQPLTGSGRFVFPSLRTSNSPMSNMTMNAAMRRMGYTTEEMTSHGFRAMARTLIKQELPGSDSEVIEAQLAHGKSGPLGSAYDRADYMQARREMMQRWADYLDRLRVGADVVPLRKAG